MQSFLNRSGLKFVFLIIVFLFISLVLVNKNKSLEIVRLNEKRNKVKKEILILNGENRLMREDIKKIRYNPVYIEKIAREEMGMLKPGEVVYKFSDGQSVYRPRS